MCVLVGGAHSAVGIDMLYVGNRVNWTQNSAESVKTGSYEKVSALVEPKPNFLKWILAFF